MMRRKINNLFSKLMVIYCVLFSSLSSLWALWIADKDGIIVNDILSLILLLFGGELLLICLRQVIGTKKCRTEEEKLDV